MATLPGAPTSSVARLVWTTPGAATFIGLLQVLPPFVDVESIGLRSASFQRKYRFPLASTATLGSPPLTRCPGSFTIRQVLASSLLMAMLGALAQPAYGT